MTQPLQCEPNHFGRQHPFARLPVGGTNPCYGRVGWRAASSDNSLTTSGCRCAWFSLYSHGRSNPLHRRHGPAWTRVDRLRRPSKSLRIERATGFEAMSHSRGTTLVHPSNPLCPRRLARGSVCQLACARLAARGNHVELVSHAALREVLRTGPIRPVHSVTATGASRQRTKRHIPDRRRNRMRCMRMGSVDEAGGIGTDLSTFPLDRF
jgi:hypothetical protein